MVGECLAVLGVDVGRRLGHGGSPCLVGPDIQITLVAFSSGRTDLYLWSDRTTLCLR